jgi:hypothetical protein
MDFSRRIKAIVNTRSTDAMSTSFQSLPNELVTKIAEFLEPESPFKKGAKRDLQNLNLTSQRLHECIPRVLFRSMELYLPTPTSRPRLDKLQPQYRTFVRNIQITLPPMIRPEWASAQATRSITALYAFKAKMMKLNLINLIDRFCRIKYFSKNGHIPRIERRINNYLEILDEYAHFFINPFMQKFDNLAQTCRPFLITLPNVDSVQGGVRAREETRWPQAALDFARGHRVDPHAIPLDLDKRWRKACLDITVLELTSKSITKVKLRQLSVGTMPIRRPGTRPLVKRCWITTMDLRISIQSPWEPQDDRNIADRSLAWVAYLKVFKSLHDLTLRSPTKDKIVDHTNRFGIAERLFHNLVIPHTVVSLRLVDWWIEWESGAYLAQMLMVPPNLRYLTLEDMSFKAHTCGQHDRWADFLCLLQGHWDYYLTLRGLNRIWINGDIVGDMKQHKQVPLDEEEIELFRDCWARRKEWWEDGYNHGPLYPSNADRPSH